MKVRAVFDGYGEFDLAAALNEWLQHHWAGQTDPLYADYCRLTAPGMYRHGLGHRLSDVEEEIYALLTRENYTQALNRVLSYKPSKEDA